MLQFRNDINFLFEIGTLRRTARTWNQFYGNDVANVAEHTMRACWIAAILAKHEGVENVGHIFKLILVHDIGEIRSADTHYVSKQYVDRHEDKAIADTFKNVSIGEEFIALWHEAEGRETIESKIMKDADTLDPDLEIMEKMYEGHKISEIRKEDRLTNINAKLFTETAKKMQREIYECNPHEWHLLAKEWK